MRAVLRDVRVFFRCCVRKFENQNIFGGLFCHAVPFLVSVLRFRSLRVLLKHIFTLVHHIAGGAILDGLESIFIGCTPVCNRERVALDWLQRSL